MTRRSYSGNAITTTLNGPITNTATSLVVVDASGYPTAVSGPYVITIDSGLTTEEKILVGARSLTTMSSLTRGYDGTTAVAHSTGASVRHTISAVDVDEANAHINSAANHVNLLVTSLATGTQSIIVKKIAGQTASLVDVQDESGASIAKVSANGVLTLTPTNPAHGPTTFTNANGGNPVLILQGAVGHSTNLQEWRNSSASRLLGVQADGSLTIDSPTSATATAGGGNTTPATVIGYLNVVVAGVARRIPFYAV
jgi:hypothetical protein